MAIVSYSYTRVCVWWEDGKMAKDGKSEISVFFGSGAL